MPSRRLRAQHRESSEVRAQRHSCMPPKFLVELIGPPTATDTRRSKDLTNDKAPAEAEAEIVAPTGFEPAPPP